jgi:hypothetical protein
MNRSGKIRTVRWTWKEIEMIKHVPFDACGAMNHSSGAKNRNQITLPSPRTDESYAIKHAYCI